MEAKIVDLQNPEHIGGVELTDDKLQVVSGGLNSSAELQGDNLSTLRHSSYEINVIGLTADFEISLEDFEFVAEKTK